MGTPDQAAATSLDAELTRLSAAGHTDDEIATLLRQKLEALQQAGVGAPVGAPGQLTTQDARKWIVHWSLGLITFYGVFFILAPSLRVYPLEFDEGAQLIEIIFPVFLGSLATAVVFAFEGREVETNAPDLLASLTRGPFFVSLILSLALFSAFWLANSTYSPVSAARPMMYGTFSALFAAITGIYTATTSALVAYLFGVEKKAKKQP